MYPIERNAFLRLPVINTNPLGVRAKDKNIWVYGEDGLILYSPDEGLTWQDLSIPPDLWIPLRENPPKKDDAPPPESSKKAAALPTAGHSADVGSGRWTGAQWSLAEAISLVTRLDGKPSAPPVNMPNPMNVPNVKQAAPDPQNFKGSKQAAPPPDNVIAVGEGAVVELELSGSTLLQAVLASGAILDRSSKTWRFRNFGKETLSVRLSEESQGAFRVRRRTDAGLFRSDIWSTVLEQEHASQWSPISAPPIVGVYSLPKQLIAVGVRDVVFASDDFGRTWRRTPLSSIPKDASAQFASIHQPLQIGANTMLAVDPINIAAVSLDGGDTWSSPTLPYRRAFAPWYFALNIVLALPLGILGIVRALHRPQSAPDPKGAGIDTVGTCDSPLTPSDPDLLNLRARARALAEFLRNEHTKPPLTIAIEGPWGSGKSSYMNLLENELHAAGFGIVKFNAWHHQTESSLLAALLAHIRRDARPHLFDLRNFRGPRFYAALFVRRFPSRIIEKPLQTLGLALIAGLSIALLASSNTSPLIKALQESTKSTEESKFSIDTILSTIVSQLASEPGRNSIGILGLFASVLIPTIRNLRAFGLDPSVLLKTMGDAPKASDAELAARSRFAGEFKEFTQTFGDDRPLTIFIDDLDRCSHESVIEMLQVMNFLVSAGPCVIVAAFDPRYARACIELGYKDLIESLRSIPDPNGSASTDTDFSSRFLQKLVQIQEIVPAPTPKQAAALMEKTSSDDSPGFKPPFAERVLGDPAVRFAAALLLFAGVVMLGLYLPDAFQNSSRPAQAASTTSGNTPASGSSLGMNSDMLKRDPSSATQHEGPIFHPAAADIRHWSAYLPIAPVPIVILGLAAVLMPTIFRGLPPATSDNAEFRKALAHWAPDVHRAGHTPREIRRLINRIRLLAAKQRNLLPAEDRIPEDVLVTLAVLNELKLQSDTPSLLYVAPAGAAGSKPWIDERGAMLDKSAPYRDRFNAMTSAA